MWRPQRVNLSGKEFQDDVLGNQLLLILHSSPAVTPLDTCHDPERKNLGGERENLFTWVRVQ